MDLADVVRRHGPAYLEKFGARMPSAHRRALAAIVRCHTPAEAAASGTNGGRVFRASSGGSLYVCDACGCQRFAYHRCGHRACGQCGFAQSEAWRARQNERLLPLTYFLVTCTIPEELRALFRRNQRLCYGMLMQESAAALQDVARQPRYLGGELGLLGVLHTWTEAAAPGTSGGRRMGEKGSWSIIRTSTTSCPEQLGARMGPFASPKIPTTCCPTSVSAPGCRAGCASACARRRRSFTGKSPPSSGAAPGCCTAKAPDAAPKP
jgi:hypothetical protein